MSAQSNAAATIIKRKKVIAGGGHHGGAWKVAMGSGPLVGGLLCPVGMGAYPAIMSSDMCDPLVSEPRHLLGACPMCPPKT